jgi:hypothetical protein
MATEFEKRWLPNVINAGGYGLNLALSLVNHIDSLRKEVEKFPEVERLGAERVLEALKGNYTDTTSLDQALGIIDIGRYLLEQKWKSNTKAAQRQRIWRYRHSHNIVSPKRETRHSPREHPKAPEAEKIKEPLQGRALALAQSVGAHLPEEVFVAPPVSDNDFGE